MKDRRCVGDFPNSKARDRFTLSYCIEQYYIKDVLEFVNEQTEGKIQNIIITQHMCGNYIERSGKERKSNYSKI